MRVYSIWAYVDGGGAGSGTGKAKMLIYSNNAGAPDALLGTSEEVSVPKGQAGEWIEFPFSSPVKLIAADYHIGPHYGGDASVLRIGTLTGQTSGSSKHNADTYVGGAADPFGSPTNDTTLLSVYAEYATQIGTANYEADMDSPASLPSLAFATGVAT